MLSIRRGICGSTTAGNGFTLAEVLITLGIIGVVAAMTLPVLSTKIRNNELETGFKKAYSNLNQVMALINYEMGGALNNDDYNRTRSFKKTLSEKFKGIDCDKSENINCVNPDDMPYKNFNGKAIARKTWFDDGQFITPDGMLFMIQNSDMTVNGHEKILAVTVDVNGINKKPNRWGQDLFTFQFVKGKLVPLGADTSALPYKDFPQYCSANNTEQENGSACAYRAISEKDFFKSLR